ncbi:MAG: hypothetical protein U0031_19520 [Thermomicrobiales bacterium]
MGESKAQHNESSAQRIATWSAALGMVAAMLIAAVSGRLLLDQRMSAATVLGSLGFTAAMVAPFVPALVSHRIRTPDVRRAVWMASGTLAIVLGVLALWNGIGWIFGVAAVGLLVAWRSSRTRAREPHAARPTLLAAWLIFWLAAALWVLDLRQTPACWNERAAGSGWLLGSAAGSCASDIIDDSEGMLAMACVAVGLAAAVPLTSSRGANTTWKHIGWWSREASPDEAPGRGV